MSVVKGKKVSYDFKDRLAKSFVGASVTYLAYAWRVKQGETNHWYEYRDVNGKLVDGRAMYGPFSMFMLYADILYRSGLFSDRPNRLPTKSWGRYAKDVLQAMAGSTFRVGLGLYTLDKLLTDLSNTEGKGSEKTDKVLAEIIGNLTKTATIPIAPFRDLYSQFDIKSSYVPETRTGETNFYSIIEARGTSNLIDFGEKTPFIGKDGLFSITELAESLDLKYDDPAYSPFETGPLMYQDPLVGQLTGEMRRKPKNLFLQELGRLNMQNYEIYATHPNDKIDRLTRFYLSQKGSESNLNEVMARIIRTKEYKEKSYEEKRFYVALEAKKIIADARAKAKGEIRVVEGSKEGAKYTTIEYEKWQSLNQRTKDAVNEFLRRTLPKHAVRNFTNVNIDKDRMVRIGNKDYNVLYLALQAVEKMKRGITVGTKR